MCWLEPYTSLWVPLPPTLASQVLGIFSLGDLFCPVPSLPAASSLKGQVQQWWIMLHLKWRAPCLCSMSDLTRLCKSVCPQSCQFIVLTLHLFTSLPLCVHDSPAMIRFHLTVLQTVYRLLCLQILEDNFIVISIYKLSVMHHPYHDDFPILKHFMWDFSVFLLFVFFQFWNFIFFNIIIIFLMLF